MFFKVGLCIYVCAYTYAHMGWGGREGRKKRGIERYNERGIEKERWTGRQAGRQTQREAVGEGNREAGEVRTMCLWPLPPHWFLGLTWSGGCGRLGVCPLRHSAPVTPCARDGRGWHSCSEEDRSLVKGTQLAMLSARTSNRSCRDNTSKGSVDTL